MWMILILLSDFFECKGGWWEDSLTLELTDNNYLQYIGSNKFIILEFYAPWCHFCQHMFPEYEAVWKHFKDPQSNWKRDDLEISRANMQANTKMGNDFQIHEYPTIGIIAPFSNKIFAFFNAERTKINFINWIDKQIEEYKEKNQGLNENLSDDHNVIEQSDDEENHEHREEEEDIEDDKTVQYEFVIEDRSAEFSNKWKGEFEALRIEIEELRKYVKEQTQEILLLTSNIKSILKDQTLTNIQHFENIEKQAEELDFNIKNRNKIESTQTRFNVTHMIVFLSLGALIGIGLGVISTKMKGKKSYEKFDN